MNMFSLTFNRKIRTFSRAGKYYDMKRGVYRKKVSRLHGVCVD